MVMRKFWLILGDWSGVVKGDKFLIKEVYRFICGDKQKVFWKNIIYVNFVFLRVFFIMWGWFCKGK